MRVRLREEWLTLRGHSAAEVTTRLNPIIRGWANYFRPFVSYQTFKALDEWMFHREVRYARHMHPKKPWYWIQSRYWGKLHRQRDDNWVFGDKHTSIVLLKFSWFNIERHALVRGTASPDDPGLTDYWANRQKQKSRVLSPSQQRIAQRQEYVCDQCGEPLLNEEELHVHHEQWRSKGGNDRYDNLTLRHLYCHQQIHARNKP
jgi:RNA-directed DNA polymerase